MIGEIFINLKSQLLAHLVDIKESIFPIYPPGIKFIVLVFTPFLVATLAEYYGFAFFYLCILFYVMLFFRNPKRYPPTKNADQLIVSPADGKISGIYLKSPPNHLEFPRGRKMKCVSIFMGFFDVHVNRAPASGKIVSQHYREGSFFAAYYGIKSGIRNEAHSFRLATKSGDDIVFVQIAGAIAKRVFSDLKDGQEIKIGEVFGMIRLGSRMEVYVPENWSIDHLVLNQRAIAGETIIAKRLG